MDAYDAAGDPVTLVHADDPALRRTAVLDAMINNADRKAGHLLPTEHGLRVVDHGVCFHVDPKLRTVLWGWAGRAARRRRARGRSQRSATALDGRPRRTARRSCSTRTRSTVTVRRVDRLLRTRPCSRARRRAGRRCPGRRSERATRRLGYSRCTYACLALDLTSRRFPGTAASHQSCSTPRRAATVALAGDGPARLYVCGITPYDATHLGHAATYLAFDLLVRAWRDSGRDVTYVQNVTDIDDPLFERAAATGEDWAALAERRDRAVPRPTWRRCGSSRRTRTSARSRRCR